MIASKCLFCGSSNLRADRALSGRLICTSCGNPFGVRKVRRGKINNFYSSKIKKLFFISLLILAFIIVIL